MNGLKPNTKHPFKTKLQKHRVLNMLNTCRNTMGKHSHLFTQTHSLKTILQCCQENCLRMTYKYVITVIYKSVHSEETIVLHLQLCPFSQSPLPLTLCQHAGVKLVDTNIFNLSFWEMLQVGVLCSRHLCNIFQNNTLLDCWYFSCVLTFIHEWGHT